MQQVISSQSMNSLHSLCQGLLQLVLLALLLLTFDSTNTFATDTAVSSTPTSIQDVLNKRCVVCHGCYDAPCQLKLSSSDGWQRGATKARVYDSSRLQDAPMTRLGIDAKTVPEWRKKGFFSVTQSDGSPSVLEQMLMTGRKNTFALGAALPDTIDIAPSRKNSCPAPAEMSNYLSDHPLGGMPFATAPLPRDDYERLLAWASDGAPADRSSAERPEAITQQIREIEAFFNQESLKSRLTARYIFEHLFLAHLYLEGDSPDRFYRIIRSRTPSGMPPDEIPSRRPFDDPGSSFHYRIIPIDGTILHKEHIVYEIGPARLKRYHDLFQRPDWTVDTLPPYSNSAGGNPLSTFQAIPARSRYQFLLDNALYFVRSFIRGPVCYGQVAVNVIQDRFWVSFLAPDSDLSVTDPTFLENAIPLLELPVAEADGKLKERLNSFLLAGPVKYQAFRRDRYAVRADQQGGLGYGDVWNGDGTNVDARLTIYRNFSSASVVTGYEGSVPETAWVIDFPLFERIYYDLVAGFDVFGNVEHQLTTRIYMDSLRREGERMFLNFMPPKVRRPMHDSWYRGPFVNLVDLWKETPLDTTSPTGVTFETGQPKAEFLTRLLNIEPMLWPVSDPINRCEGDVCAPPETIAGQLRPLTVTPAPFAKYLPDVSVLVVETDTAQEVFTLAHDKAHSNVAFIFNEDLRREPDKDTLTIVPGQFGSYPNFVFKVDSQDLPAFVQALSEMGSQDAYVDVVDRFGIRRTHPDFWSTYDLVQAHMNAQSAVQAGLLDLNRYVDPKPSDPIERLFEYTFSLD
ncbi:fatty acid cis/trans isomerase [Roseibium sp. SCPC15]|uniref:fatty acid cis/trans isomerase n=1 Tax=Roseibium sp. SCP15 TaxID=3141376 RepID=UPI0033364E17